MKTICHKKTVFVLLTLLITISCTNDIDYNGNDTFSHALVEEEQEQGPHHIKVSEALNRFESALSALEISKTRTLRRGQWTIEKVPMSVFKPQTRSSEVGSTDAIYVVNFDNNEGFAILAADDRLPDDIIAVTNSGNISFNPNPFDDSIDTLKLEDLFVPEDNDYLLGSMDNSEFIESLVANYVIGWTDSLPGMEDEFGDIPFIPIDSTYTTIEYTPVINYPALLNTKWHQRSPYNDYCPNRYYRYLFSNTTHPIITSIEPYTQDTTIWGDRFIKLEDLAAGCVSIAVGQIVACLQYPTVSQITNDINAMEWDSLNLDFNSDRSKHYLASLVHNIGIGCNMRYGYHKQQSFATPKAAKDYFIELGYQNVDKHEGYDLETIISQIEKGCPVFIGALGPVSDKTGHAWVIDGYQYANSKRITKDTNGNIISVQDGNTYHFVHCNWGWGGNCDGWFTSNLMDSEVSFNTERPHSYDDLYGNTAKYTYTWWFRLITFDKPNTNN